MNHCDTNTSSFSQAQYAAMTWKVKCIEVIRPFLKHYCDTDQNTSNKTYNDTVWKEIVISTVI